MITSFGDILQPSTQDSRDVSLWGMCKNKLVFNMGSKPVPLFEPQLHNAPMEHCYTCLGTAERDLLIEQGGNNLTQSSHSNTSHFMLRVWMLQERLNASITRSVWFALQKKHPQAIVNFWSEGAFILFLCWRESETYISMVILKY